MHTSFLKKITAVVAASVTVFALGGAVSLPTAMAVVDADMDCSSMTLVSGASTQTAGYTQVDPGSAPASLSAGAYSGGSFTGAVATQTVIPPWLDPATNGAFTGSGAAWVSTGASWPGGSGNTEGSATSSQWRLFHQTFSVPSNATSVSVNVSFAADNAATAYLNGASIATTGDVYGTTSSTATNYATVTSSGTSTAVAGTNSLDFVLRNWSTDAASNPTGLLYKATVNYCVPAAPDTVKVTIVKFIDGAMATATSTGGASFSMNASWNSTSTGAGSGTFTLGPTGFNSPNAYTAVTANMTSGASYSTSEVVGGSTSTVGMACNSGATSTPPFALLGYTSGNTLSAAMAAAPTSTSPNFTNLTGDKTVIVWNRNCANATDASLQVNGVTVVKGDGIADNSYADGWKYVFHLTVPTSETDLAMKFSNWTLNGSTSTTMAVGGNMRISSAQASTTSTVTVSGADTYTSPNLSLTGDLDPSTPGRQVDVLVEVKIPSGTPNGTYSTSFGVRSL